MCYGLRHNCFNVRERKSKDGNLEKEEEDLEEFDDTDRYGFDASPEGDDGRYASARGWDPYRKEDEKYKKLREDHRRKHPQITYGHNMLDVRQGSEWLTDNDVGVPSEPLFGNFWRTGEVAMLFADTGIGKSILAVQIADALSQAKPVLWENGKCKMDNGGGSTKKIKTEASDEISGFVGNSPFSILDSQFRAAPRPRTVLYVDYELSQQQWAERYARTSRDGRRFVDKYKFAANFHRAQSEPGEIPDVFSSIADAAYHSIEMTVEQTKAEVVILDNITWLTEANLVGGRAAANLMKGLKQLRDTQGVSILVIAHARKRAVQRPLSINDVAGSKNIVNFLDKLFAVGTSVHDPAHRYIKHAKVRSNAPDHGAENVIVCRLEKERNFPRFTYLYTDTELSQISRPYDNTNGDRTRLAALARQLRSKGLTQRQIAQHLSIGVATVNRYLNQDGTS